MAINFKEKKPRYYLNQEGEFVIENYNFSKPFASFFPGIAGKYGIPMWTFYVNRGQAIISFGTKDKDHSILEFFPANKSWQLASTHGFRTLIKLKSANKYLFYEPFHNGYFNLNFDLTNEMRISSSGLILKEINRTLGICVTVKYFNIPNDSYAGIVRVVSFKNLGHSAKELQIVDGLPQIVPFGTSNFFLKKLGRTIEAWMKVENLKNNVPFYKLAVDPSDRPEVVHIKEGNFYLGFYFKGNKPVILKPLVDPEEVFGPATDFSSPIKFLASDNFKPPLQKNISSKTPCGMSFAKFSLGKKEEKSFNFVLGYMRNIRSLIDSVPKITSYGYLLEKETENNHLIEKLKNDINTNSSSRKLDLYAKQTYLDNILRGGYPLTFESKSGKSVFYIYSRKHGDLERDYNKFQLQPTYLSQGNCNYRDTNQNRRNDIWFNPAIGDENIITFFNLLQADGFNPLIIKGANFAVKEKTDLKKLLNNLVAQKDITKLISRLESAFAPGELILFIEDNNLKINVSYDEFLNVLLSNCLKIQEAEHGEGFWTDHWTYNLDLLESYSAIYPEKYLEILFDKAIFTFFDNTEALKPRSEKYLLKDGSVKQFHSLASDGSKKELIRKRHYLAHIARADNGKGEIYNTTLINKLFCLFANKLSSLDPFGIGMEMEADKPNWFDALNGLPALGGSSLCETLELKRLALIMKDALSKTAKKEILLSEETFVLLGGIESLIKEYFEDTSSDKDYKFWDDTHALKEDYRRKTRLGFSGRESTVGSEHLMKALDYALQKIDEGINKAFDKKKGVYYSYFINEVKEFEIIKGSFVKPTKFIQKKIPFFLEGQMHALRLAKNTGEAKKLHRSTKASGLYDKKLKMYKVTASLQGMPEEIGRCRVFTPGWLENESIWLHMEYKYILELLKQGLCEDFYAEFKNTLVPFQDPQKYGRSILENSSFIVSSAFPQKELRGNGFVARLSGSTAEFLHIWLIMNIGKNPFFINKDGELNLIFKPSLPGWLFNKKGIYNFTFLRKINVTYFNPKRKNTFGVNAVKTVKIVLTDTENKPDELKGSIIPSPYAQKVRSLQIKQIDIYLK